MSLTKEFMNSTDIPYYPFPENPRTIEVGGFSVWEYLTPEAVSDRINTMADQLNMKNYDEILVNMKGGIFLFDRLSEISGYNRKPVMIEYHRPEDGYGALVTIPVPSKLTKAKVLVVDDIYDSGGVLSKIRESISPESEAVALVTKRGIPNQIQIPKLLIGLSIDKKWIGGCGMDLGIEGEGDIFRNYPGIVVKKPTI